MEQRGRMVIIAQV